MRNAFTNFIQRNMSYYAVAIGRKVGIYDSWAKCSEQVSGFKGAKHKKFPTREAAEEFIAANSDAKPKNYVPLEHAVALGKQQDIQIWPKSIKEQLEEAKKTEDYWPESDGDSFELPESDLLAALHATEGLSAASSDSGKKRNSEAPSKKAKIPKYESKIWEPVGEKQIGEHKYQIDCEGYVICYTDGSCFNNGKKNASAGYGVYFCDDHELNAAEPVRGRVTNNAGEIQAAIHAIKTAKAHGIEKLCISTDSQFLIKAVELWMKSWKAKNWSLKGGGAVKNVVDFKELDELLLDKKVKVKWNYVKGHNDIKGNEMADKLAREGTAKYKIKHNVG